LDYLLDINTPNVKGYYSYCNDKVSITRKVVLLLSNESNLDNHYINFSQEYHKAGYDLFIFDSSMDAKAGSKAFEYLIKNYNVDTDSILLHGHSRSGGKVIELYESLNNKGYFPEGIVLSSSNNDLISVLNKENKLQHKTKIYISCDSKTTDENNKLIIKTLKAYGHDVKEFSFSHRNEYNSFRHVKDNQQDPIRKFSIYKSRDLELTPIGNILVPIVGMPSGDQKTLAKIANSENLIIGIRAIDNKSTALIASKEYSSKNLFIKGKSSDWGPMSGFIPVDQSLAKSSARNDVAKYNSAIQESINQGYAISVPLILSLERVNELKHNNILKFPGMLTDIIRVSSKIDNREYDFFLSKSNDNEYTVNYYDNSKLVPISVLGDQISKKPIIADYDLFTVMYSYNDLGEKTVIKKMMPWEEWKNSVDYEKLSPTFQEYYNDKALYERYEGEALGLISSKVKDVKDKINIALLREPGKEMVHHGADDANPYSVINDNFPATFFVPDEILNKNLNNEKNTLKDYFIVNENNTIIIRNTKEFSDFQQLMINHGFIAPLNERWNDGTEIDYFTKKRKTSHSYLKNRNILESKNHPNRYKSSLEEINNKYFDSTIKIIKSNNLDNIITTNIYKANEEIALLSSPYDHKKAIDIYLDNNDLYKKLPLSLKKDINKYRYDLDWFCEGGNKLFDYLMSSPENYLNRNDSKKLNNVFNIILELPEIKGSIYKSINVENLNAYFENIEQGTIFANDSILIANRNSQKIKNKTNNVFISIQGEHNAKTMTGISDRLTDQVILSPGKHFRVIKKEKIKGNLYMV
ncbi:CyaA/EF/ExoY family adenylyl cyclase toxin, partial [Proteus myxofaciens]|uniref:CyaA/EF/ExoY family adenylyl cyclase toxin n=1 Tax=Proteus myxofaciens TaxID=184072 RepID=UPI000A740F27